MTSDSSAGEAGKPCIFPWTYSGNGVNYQGCANPDGDEGGPWCATGVDYDGVYIFFAKNDKFEAIFAISDKKKIKIPA